jgi:hypothetical protein
LGESLLRKKDCSYDIIGNPFIDEKQDKKKVNLAGAFIKIG